MMLGRWRKSRPFAEGTPSYAFVESMQAEHLKGAARPWEGRQ
jgi:hypothetical protein